MNRPNIASRDNMDRQTVQSAWDQYYTRQAERKEAEGGEVCATVYGPGNVTYRSCMSRATAMEHYRGNFSNRAGAIGMDRDRPIRAQLEIRLPFRSRVTSAPPFDQS